MMPKIGRRFSDDIMLLLIVQSRLTGSLEREIAS